MSVRRYRDVAEMPPPSAGDRRDPATYARIRELWRFASRLPPLFRPGVYKFHSIEASEHAREQATLDRMRRMRARRFSGG